MTISTSTPWKGPVKYRGESCYSGGYLRSLATLSVPGEMLSKRNIRENIALAALVIFGIYFRQEVLHLDMVT